MARNLKLLTDDELVFLINHYDFEYNGFVYARKIGCNRITCHDAKKPFIILSDVRKITISPQAMHYWIKYFNRKYSLFEVQNAINFLIITYQNISRNEIKAQLKRQEFKIKRNLKER